MSKIVQAINAMISNPKLFNKIIKEGEELFFLYKEKYKWSMRRNDAGAYFLYYYPTQISLEDLARFEPYQWENFSEMIIYRDSDIGTKEAKSSFADLYRLLTEKVFGVDEVLEDIISDEEPF